MPLNRNRPYGIISPGFEGAAFEQKGTDGVVRYFNSGGLEVDVKNGGKVIEPIKDKKGEKADKPKVATLTERASRARELLDQRDMKPFSRFAIKAAAFIGGDNPPERKEDIVTALEKIAGEEVLAEETGAEVENGGTDGMADEQEPRPLVGDEKVNLKAWARGEQKYVAADVFAAIRDDYAINVASKRDAVEALVSVGLVGSDECVQFTPEQSVSDDDGED